MLDKYQTIDQAGFRQGLSTVHHLFALMQLQEKCQEWQQNVWIAAIDFKKAFDCVEHRCLWAALGRQIHRGT